MKKPTYVANAHAKHTNIHAYMRIVIKVICLQYKIDTKYVTIIKLMTPHLNI